VVTARLPGPAWWTVSNGTTTVYVLGAPSLAPKRMAWDRKIFERRLAGSSVVILPVQDVRVTFTGAFGAAFNYMRLRSEPRSRRRWTLRRAHGSWRRARGSASRPSTTRRATPWPPA
jgi:hypothetical protein